MKQTESDFWGSMKNKLQLDLMKRVENRIEPGWPDVYYMHKAFPGWIELKSEEKLPLRIDFEPAQPLWLTDYARKGGDCYVFLKITSTNEIYIWQGSQAMELNKTGGPKFTPFFLLVKDTSAGWSKIYEEIFK